MKRKLLFPVLILIIFLTVFIYTSQLDLLEISTEPVRKITQKTLKSDDPFLEMRQEIYANMERLQIFWQKRIDASVNKDYYLVVSLQDSMLWLDINGTSVHQGKIRQFEVSPELLVRCGKPEINTWLQTPFFLNEQWATIPKQPIRTKDISGEDFNLDSLDFRPSKVDSTDVYVVFTYNKSFRLGFRQQEPVKNINPYLKKQIPPISDDLYVFTQPTDSLSYRQLLSGEWLSIIVDPSDIIAVYRALNLSSQLVIGI
jgi:hypothetical protein